MKSVLQPSVESLVIRKIELMQILEGSGRMKISRPGRKTVIKERSEIESEILKINEAIKKHEDFESKFKRGILTNDPEHFNYIHKGIIDNILKKPQRSKAGKISIEKRKKKVVKWHSAFAAFYKSQPKNKFDSTVSDRAIILKFITLHKRKKSFPKTERPYYKFLEDSVI